MFKLPVKLDVIINRQIPVAATLKNHVMLTHSLY
jgi:hypothetical protein